MEAHVSTNARLRAALAPVAASGPDPGVSVVVPDRNTTSGASGTDGPQELALR